MEMTERGILVANAGFGGKAVEPSTNVLHMLLTSFYGKVPEANETVEFAGIARLCGYALDEIEKTPVALANATFVTFALFLQICFYFY